MSDIIKYIENLTIEFKRLSYDYMENCSNDEKLLYLYTYYHHFNADSSKISDIFQGKTYVWDSLDKIAGIYIDQEADNYDVDAIIVKFTEENKFDFPATLKVFKDAEAALINANESKPTCRKEIRMVLEDDDYKFSQTKPLKIQLVTNYNPKNVGEKRSILNAISVMKPVHPYISYMITFGYDIEHEILEIENPREYVDEACITVDGPNNFACFGEEQSIIVNISAFSLKQLYELYCYRGLFAQNLRYYVKNSKVDDNIIESIQNYAGDFWYFNNGIIIICDKYSTEGTTISLSNLSIINGGQTTKLIGETEFSEDFFIQCKIIKNKYIADEDRLEFISNVAEASNTQKPIKEKDLIANRIEQRLLKKQLAGVGIYCQIKRGEKVNKKLYPTAWQNTTNEELGQFLLSFVYQKPGTARGSKSSICGNQERYSLLFEKKYNNDFLGDILKIKAYYKLWVNYVKKNDDDSDAYKIGLVNNGMLFMTAIIGSICKIYYHPEFIGSINASVMSEQKLEIVSQHDIDHHIFKSTEDIKSTLFSLFDYCYIHFYRPGYEFLKTFKDKYNNYSNFTKVNSNYTTYVFKQIAYEFRNGIIEADAKLLGTLLYQANDEEIKRDQVLLEKYVNVIYSDIDSKSDLPDETISAIKDALVAYRTKTFKLHRIKAYEVFRNISCDRIAKFAPYSIEDLKNLHCLDETQLTLYGQAIVDIVKRVLSV
jgi:hypothetical protein